MTLFVGIVAFTIFDELLSTMYTMDSFSWAGFERGSVLYVYKKQNKQTGLKGKKN